MWTVQLRERCDRSDLIVTTAAGRRDSEPRLKTHLICFLTNEFNSDSLQFTGKTYSLHSTAELSEAQNKNIQKCSKCLNAPVILFQLLQYHKNTPLNPSIVCMLCLSCSGTTRKGHLFCIIQQLSDYFTVSFQILQEL